MSQRRQNDSKNCKSYSKTLDSSWKDGFNSKIKSNSYSSGDREIKERNHRSRKSDIAERQKSLFEGKNSDSEFRKYYDRRNHHDRFLNHKDDEGEKIHKSCHSKRCKGGSQSLREDCHHNLNPEEYFKRCYSTDINNSTKSKTYDLWKDEAGKNRKKDEVRVRNRELEKFHFEGSARTREFYFARKKNIHEIQNKRGIDSIGNLKKELHSDNWNLRERNNSKCVELEDFGKRRQESNSRSQRKTRKRSENLSAKGDSLPIKETVRSKKSENLNKNYLASIAKDSIHSCDHKTLKIKKVKDLESEKCSNKEDFSSFNTKFSSELDKSDSSKYSSKRDSKKSKLSEERKTCRSLTSENDPRNESDMKNEEERDTFNDSYKDEIKAKVHKIKKSRIKNHRRKYKNYSNKKTCLLMYLIRKLIVSDEDNKNYGEIENLKSSKTDSCIQIKDKIKIDSSCESSGYDSLKNMPEQALEIIKNHSFEAADDRASNTRKDLLELTKSQVSDTLSSKGEKSFLNFCKYSEMENLENNNIEFIDSEKYCLYKIYKSIDGRILLKESQSVEFNKGGYVLGRRNFQDKELLQFSKKDELLEKNPSQLCEFRNNSTQTELNTIASKKISRKHSWFRNKSQRTKKHLASLESTSNSSFHESSDFEQFNLPRKRKVYSQKSLSRVTKPVSFLKKSAAVDTSDLNYSTFTKIPENKIILLFNSAEIEKNLECRLLNSGETSACEQMKLNEVKEIKTFEKNSLDKCSVDPVKGNYFHSSDTSSKLDNSELVSRETKFKEKEETNCNYFQSAAETVNKETHDQSVKKEKSKYFRIFKKKKK